nr:hypothetical protein RAR13_09510 [Aminobacter aminovorans]
MKALLEAADRVREFRLHPLGFFYLQVGEGEGRAQRVHVWLPGGPDRPENDRHQHSFDIDSLVVAGRMRSELFSFEEVEGGPEAEFAVAYEGKASILSPSGRKGQLLPIVSFDTVAGATYRLEAGVIHRVAVTERPCITLVQTQERHIPIFSYGHEDEATFDRRLCSDGEAEEIRHQLINTAGR